jgi:hypothetical protein
MENELFCDIIVSTSYWSNKKKHKELHFKLLRHKFGDSYVEKCIFDNLKENLRSRCYNAFKNIKQNKPFGTNKLLGADFYTVKKHLESKFTEGMNWDKMGKYGWHIDHIKPLALASNKEELIELCHYTNLQPLWWKDNLKKNSDYNGIRITYKNREQWKKR